MPKLTPCETDCESHDIIKMCFHPKSQQHLFDLAFATHRDKSVQNLLPVVGQKGTDRDSKMFVSLTPIIPDPVSALVVSISNPGRPRP